MSFGKLHPEYGAGDAKIPLLEEVLAYVHDETKMVINIELKTGVFFYPGIEAAAVHLVHKFGMEDRVIYSSFNHYTLKRVKELCPEMKVGALTGARLIDMAGYAKTQGFDAMHPLCRSITPEIAKELISSGVETNVWGIDGAESIRRMFKAGVTAVIGDDPELTSRIRQDMEEEEDWPLGWSMCGYDE